MSISRHVFTFFVRSSGIPHCQTPASATCDSVRVILSCGSLSFAIYANADDSKINSKTAYIVYLAHKIG